MVDPRKLPAEERAKLRKQAEGLYQERGGEDIDRAINRDRKVLELHERELEYVSTLPFDQHYRWRIAPSVALRAQKDLERQQKRREELFGECVNEVLWRATPKRPAGREDAPQPDTSLQQEIEQFTAQFADTMDEVRKWQEGEEASPPVPNAA